MTQKQNTEFTPGQIVQQYQNSLITWDEMQAALRKQGYELRDDYNTGRFYLLPCKGHNRYN